MAPVASEKEACNEPLEDTMEEGPEKADASPASETPDNEDSSDLLTEANDDKPAAREDTLWSKQMQEGDKGMTTEC